MTEKPGKDITKTLRLRLNEEAWADAKPEGTTVEGMLSIAHRIKAKHNVALPALPALEAQRAIEREEDLKKRAAWLAAREDAEQ